MNTSLFFVKATILTFSFFLVKPAFTVETTIPQTVQELWSDFDRLDKRTHLDIEVTKEWDVENIHLKLVRFTVAVIDGQKTIVSGYYAYPKGAKNLPGLLQINGGPQRAFTRGPVNWAKKGYAVLNPHLSETPISEEGGDKPASDWGNLMHQRRDAQSDDKTQEQGMDPRDSEWYARIVAARRCLTFLQNQPEVSPDILGVRGHSTGGVLTVYTMIDPRVKAAVPSVGGPGFWHVPQEYLIGTTRGGVKDPDLQLYLRTLSGEAYWKVVKCPVLFLGATNDFNSPFDNVARSIGLVPHENKRLVIAPHLNHRFTPEAENSVDLWFEEFLKNNFVLPKTAGTRLELKTKDGIPVLKVWPDTETSHKICSVNIYYSYDREPQARFWGDGMAEKVGDQWEGKCPVFYKDGPLFAFANVVYEESVKDKSNVLHNTKAPQRFLITSQYQTAYPENLQKAGVKVTEESQRLIDDFSRGFNDWVIHLDNPHSWSIETRKLIDPRWVGPKGGELVIDIKTTILDEWLGVSIARRFLGKNSREFLFYYYYRLPKAGWNTVRLKPANFVNAYGQKLDDWHKILSLSFGPASNLVGDHNKSLSRAKDKAVFSALPENISAWKGEAPQFRNVRWEGGEYIPRSKPWENDRK